MTGVTSSKRQWASWRVRALTAALLALALLIPLIGTAHAQDAQWPPYYGNNRLCVQGRVINFDETPLPYSDLYTADDPSTFWVITAVSASTGITIPVELDEDGFFTLDESDGLTTGAWTISLTIPPNSGWEAVDPYTTELNLNLDYGMKDCAKVRFKLRFPITVIVYKIDDQHNPLEGWTIRAQPARGNWFASPVEEVTDANGQIENSFRLTPGKWIFTERAPKGVHFTPVVPLDGRQELNVDPRDFDDPATGVYELRFKNRLYNNGCLDVYKQDSWPTDPAPDVSPTSFGLPGWKMTVKRLDGTFVASGVTDAQGHVVFKNLPFGLYVVTEETRAGWTSDFATSVQVTVAPTDDDSCTPVTFTNEQSAAFCIEGYKLDANGHVGIPNWEITATPLAKGGFPNPHLDTDINGVPLEDHLTAYTDGSGKYVFGLDDATAFPDNDYRIPGAAYKVCEADVDGWLPHTPKCRTVYLPKQPGACVRVPDFVNQQVGHSEAMAYGPRPSSSGYGCANTHTVAPGESLFGIGNSYGVSARAMLAANKWIYGRPNHYVYPGDSVCIP